MSGDALSVSDALALAKGALETVRIRVIGEVSELTDRPGYKAIYFSLKDEGAVMPCIMWRDVYASCGTRIRDGQSVEVTGLFTAYVAKGRMQFQVRALSVAGEGVLRMQVAALARTLEIEGLMAPERKRRPPQFPRRIGLVTSPRGKAVHDVLRTLRRRYPLAEVVLAGVQVEGEGAVAELVRGIETVGREPGVDVVILGRGGGSYEDLMPFNSEALARAIVACPVPVVTGIGHEPDTSIADMVADVRASTPTAAAEAVAPDRADLTRRIVEQRRMLARTLERIVHAHGHRLGLVSHGPAFRDPTVLFAARLQTLDLLADSLDRVLPDRLSRQEDVLARARDALQRLGPRLLESPGFRLGHARVRALNLGRGLLVSFGHALSSGAERLEDLSPLGILRRGYAVCYDDDDRIVRTASAVAVGAHVRVRVGEGELGCTVDTVGSEP